MCIRDRFSPDRSFAFMQHTDYRFRPIRHLSDNSRTFARLLPIDFNADISWEALLEIEQTANLYIYEDHPIDIPFHRGAELDKIDYRSKKPLEGDVRICLLYTSPKKACLPLSTDERLLK